MLNFELLVLKSQVYHHLKICNACRAFNAMMNDLWKDQAAHYKVLTTGGFLPIGVADVSVTLCTLSIDIYIYL